MTPESFTIRVYGVLIANGKVLLSRENILGNLYTKFPGGGLEFGEGVIDCLKREFMEEVAIELNGHELFYINEDYLKSAFHTSKQVISVYYKVKTSQLDEIKTGDPSDKSQLRNYDDQVLFWVPITELHTETVELPADVEVVKRLSQSMLY